MTFLIDKIKNTRGSSRQTLARRNKADEFYTLIENIVAEVKYHEKFLAGKSVLCNCNDGENSAFYQFFKTNFKRLGLKKLVCISFAKNSIFTYFTEHAGHGRVFIITGQTEKAIDLYGEDGSYSSKTGKKYLAECDIVITNPPFSRLRHFLQTIWIFKKDFLIIGPQTILWEPHTFDRIKKGEFFIGYTHRTGGMNFKLPEESQNFSRISKAESVSVAGTRWLTSLPTKTEPIKLAKEYSPELHKKYDNAVNWINVDKTRDIPKDYDGVMGVPPSFLNYYTPEQFDLIKSEGGLILDGKNKYQRILIQHKKGK